MDNNGCPFAVLANAVQGNRTATVKMIGKYDRTDMKSPFCNRLSDFVLLHTKLHGVIKLIFHHYFTMFFMKNG